MPSWSHSWQDSPLYRSRVGFNFFIADSSGLGLMLVILNLSFILDWTTNPLSLSIWERLLCTGSHTCPLFNLFSLSTSSLYCSLRCTQTLTYMRLLLWCSLSTAVLTSSPNGPIIAAHSQWSHSWKQPGQLSHFYHFYFLCIAVEAASISSCLQEGRSCWWWGLPCALGPLEAALLSLLTVYLFVLHWPAHPISKFVGVWYVLCMPDTVFLIALSSLIPADKVAFLLWVTTYY